MPRAIPFRTAMTTLDVLIEVGGLTRYADGDRSVLVREVNGKADVLSRAAHRFAHHATATSTANVDMQPGDILIIPQRYF